MQGMQEFSAEAPMPSQCVHEGFLLRILDTGGPVGGKGDGGMKPQAAVAASATGRLAPARHPFIPHETH